MQRKGGLGDRSGGPGTIDPDDESKVPEEASDYLEVRSTTGKRHRRRVADSTEYPLIVIEEKAEEGEGKHGKKREVERTVSSPTKHSKSKQSVRRLRSEEEKESANEFREKTRSRHSRHSSMKRLKEKSRPSEETKGDTSGLREGAPDTLARLGYKLNF